MLDSDHTSSDHRISKAERFAEIWWKSRAAAGKSQEYMALAIGVSKKTIQNWEKGISSPSLFQSAEWFQALGINPFKYYLSFLYPNLFEDIGPESDDKKIEAALINLIKESPPIEKRQLLYLMAGDHGSSWYALLQMFTAHTHTSLKSRVIAANVILENYEMESETDALACKNCIMPDVDLLKHAIDEGKKSVIARKSGYTTQGSINNGNYRKKV